MARNAGGDYRVNIHQLKLGGFRMVRERITKG